MQTRHLDLKMVRVAKKWLVGVTCPFFIANGDIQTGGVLLVNFVYACLVRCLAPEQIMKE